jgi:hypothetical protein
VIVHAVKKGPLRVAIEANEGALALFSDKERAKIVRRGMERAGWTWAKKWMPLRFTRYAFKLGYRVSARWVRYKMFKLGEAIPFVGMTPPGGGDMSGHWTQRNKAKMIVQALGRVKVTAKGGKGQEEVTIRVPYGHAIQTQHSKWFKTVTDQEAEDMARALSKRVADEMNGARVVNTREGGSVLKARTLRTNRTRSVNTDRRRV